MHSHFRFETKFKLSENYYLILNQHMIDQCNQNQNIFMKTHYS